MKNKAIFYPKIFLPAAGGFINREMVALGRAVLGRAGRRELDGWKPSAPSLGMWGRKILLVGRFFGDGPAGFCECVVPPLGGRIDGFY